MYVGRYVLLAVLALALAPAGASAATPAAKDESVQIANPTTVPLEATETGAVEMTFAIASNPAHGSLGPISSPTCQPTGNGSTDCKASVSYTPDQCTNGPDSFTYTATDSGTHTTSSPATVTLNPGPAPPMAAIPPPTLPQVGAVAAGGTFSATVTHAQPGATVDYGDGSGTQALAVDSNGNAPLSHVYAAEGSYTLTATNYGSCGYTTSASERVDAVAAGVLAIATASAPPGSSATIAIPGATSLTATLTIAQIDPSSAGIVGATYPATSPLFGLAGPAGEVLAAYDVRVINATTNDSAVVTFGFPDGGVPTAASVRYFDELTHTFLAVQPSTLAPNSLVIDVPHHRVTIVFDRTSVPSLTRLVGTRFAVIGRPPKISRLAVTPRCVAPSAVRSLRLRLTLSQRASLVVAVHRRAGVRPPRRCGGRRASRVPAGRRVLRLRAHLRPGVYTVSVRARNVHGRSRLVSTSFAVAAR